MVYMCMYVRVDLHVVNFVWDRVKRKGIAAGSGLYLPNGNELTKYNPSSFDSVLLVNLTASVDWIIPLVFHLFTGRTLF